MLKRKNLTPQSEFSLAEIDTRLLELGDLHQEIAQKAAEMDAAIKAIKEKTKAETGEAMKQARKIEKEIHDFIRAHPELWKTQKTRKMNHGEIGMRKSPGAIRNLPEWTAARVMEAIRKHKTLTNYLKVKEELDKIKLLQDVRAGVVAAKAIERCGMQLNDSDEPFAKPYLSTLADTTDHDLAA